MVRDAVKKPLPKDAPVPGAFRMADPVETELEPKKGAAQKATAPAAPAPVVTAPTQDVPPAEADSLTGATATPTADAAAGDEANKGEA